MDKSEILQKTAEKLAPFETANVIDFVKHLTVQKAISNPWIIGVFLVIAFYAVVVRSKLVLSILFTAISLLLLVRYAMPVEGEISLSSTLPLAFGGLAIGAVLIYINLIKTE